MENNTTNYNVKIKKLPASTVEITATIPAEQFDHTRADALARIGKDVAIDGFRKGHVPPQILATKVGEAAILEEMAEIAIARAYPSILISEKIDALGRPEVRITKIAPGNPLEFTLTTAVFPEITLPDYKKIAAKIAKKREDVEVKDEEIDKTITEIQKMRAAQEAQEKGEERDENAALPELDQDYLKTLGDFSSIDDLRTKLRENLTQEKARRAKDKTRVEIMEGIVADAKMELPEIIIEQELHRMHDEFSHEIERMGMTFESYANAVGKSAEEMEKEWRPDAEKRAKVQLLTAKIAEVEAIKPDEARLKEESAALRSTYPEASEERITDYLSMILTNEKVFEFLESQA